MEEKGQIQGKQVLGFILLLILAYYAGEEVRSYILFVSAFLLVVLIILNVKSKGSKSKTSTNPRRIDLNKKGKEPKTKSDWEIMDLPKGQKYAYQGFCLFIVVLILIDKNYFMSRILWNCLWHASIVTLTICHFIFMHPKRQKSPEGKAAARSMLYGGYYAIFLLVAAFSLSLYIYKTDMDIHTAVYWGDTRRVSSLLASGADPNRQGTITYPPLPIGTPIRRGWVDPIRKGRTKSSPLAFAVAGMEGDTGMASLLLDGGADVNARDDRGLSPLHTAIKADRPVGVVSFLLDRGADTDIQDKQGLTPLVFQCRQYALKGRKATAEFERRVLARLSVLLEKGSRFANELGRRECLRILGKGQPNARKIVSLLDAQAQGGDF